MSQDASPCVGICEIDEGGYCIGCGRSADEIFGNTDSAIAAADAVTDVLKPLPGEPVQSSD
ncbi:DUF1289 domain-containing protein [Zoogloea sp.]|uniref:DUF1289 domain-containing protein n=1 Tax=Zoogloea sp. TaxID=49181 RepID=UPI002638A924|nr:DUF1289 domain-containing protein [Zoogloea sp.]MDD3353745.1 DUF1289 domain-containing protein [Zoogloea sp.]